jgi:Xaa-Pro aminopeptidase
MALQDQKQKLSALRKKLRSIGVAAIIVPRADEYQGEYVPPCSERLNWITGFSGSWGTAIIGTSSAALIVDGRYTFQAAAQTAGLGIRLLTPEAKSLFDYLSESYKPKDHIAYDPWLTTIAEAKRLSNMLDSLGMKLVPLTANPIDSLWADRPNPPANSVYAHAEKYAGQSATDKLQMIANWLKSNTADAVVLSDPLSVAWTFNVRGTDIPYTPAALMRAIITKTGKAILFVDNARLSALFAKSVTIMPPASLPAELKSIGAAKKRVAVDPAHCPVAIQGMLQKAGAAVVELVDPCILPRARKNKVEQQGARAAHLRDGAAVCNFLYWLDSQGAQSKLTEKAVQDHLLKCRKATGKLMDLSFGTISASGPNAAHPHYQVKDGEGRRLRAGEIYLIDSGGQYRDGTTDITRTIIIGTPTEMMRKHFTLVLKGMIAVSLARFPVGTTGVQLDALARAALWQHGYDFDHGTGHGVGSFLSVHEGPARISKAGTTVLEPGMILSNEPGHYVQGKYGIRIENLLLVKPAQKPKQGDRAMLSFETLTFAPIDKRLIDTHLLTRAELHWLDSYHADVFQKLQKRVDVATRPWLEATCAPFT